MADCNDYAIVNGCYTDPTTGARTNVFIHYLTGVDNAGNVVTLTPKVTDALGAELTVAAADVTAGACPVAQPDVEWIELCDVQADGSIVNFACRTITSFNADGTVAEPGQVDYFELDKVTAYAPTGTVQKCSDLAPDVEWLVLCDVQADGSIVRFYRRVVTEFDANGAPLATNTVDDFAQDLVTAYAPTGSIQDCADCIPADAADIAITWA